MTETLPGRRGSTAAIRFITRLARSLHRYGVSADRMEEALAAVAEKLSLAGSFFVTPTGILCSFESRRGAETRLIRMDESELHLEKLVAADRVMLEVLAGEYGPDEAYDRLVQIEDAADRFGPKARILGYAMSSALFAAILGGNFGEIGVVFLAGLVVGSLCSRLMASPRLRPIAVPTAAAIAASVGFGVFGEKESAALLTTVATIILLMPGMKLTIGMRELATQHLSSGTVRLTAALRTLLGMAMGLLIGQRIATLVPASLIAIPNPAMDGLWIWVAAVLLPVALVVDYRGRFVDLPAVSLGCAAAWFGANFGVAYFGSEIGAFAGAVAVGLSGNLYGRIFDRPSTLVQIPGVTLLVPGSLGFRSVFSMLDHETLPGIELGFAVLMIGAALGSGLIVANVLLPPRRAL